LTEAVAIALAALASLAGAAAPAAEAARAAPVRVDAETVVYAFQQREVTFTGKAGKPVILTRDDARLTCQKLVAHTDETGQIVTAACSGDVHFTRGARLVTCERAIFDGPADRVVCEGNPVLRDGGSEARGTRLVYELGSDRANLEGAVITLPGEQLEKRQKALGERRKDGRP
jgi:lipopolysaccharide export system protein LptA